MSVKAGTDTQVAPPTLAGVWLALGYTLAHAALAVPARRHVDVPGFVWAVDLAVAAACGAILWRAHAVRLRAATNAIVRGALLWVPVAYFLWCYRWSGWTLHAIFPPEFTLDAALIAFENLFGQPALWLARGRSRLTTETLHAFYVSYYLYTALIGIYLHARRRYADLEEMTCAILIGYAVSYVVFALLPLWGPRWALVDAGLLPIGERRLVGYGITTWINGIQWDGMALKGGAMPSSHTSTGVVFLYWCWRLWGRRGGIPATVVVAGMALGALYGRYHYVTDVTAGALLAYAAIVVARRWTRTDDRAAARAEEIA
jgi:membrane-associated phospholipid phosphatase